MLRDQYNKEAKKKISRLAKKVNLNSTTISRFEFPQTMTAAATNKAMSITIEDHLIKEFIDAMKDIGDYGYEKYGVNSFEYAALKDNRLRSVRTANCLEHAEDHIKDYSLRIPHDHYRTLKHQLAAVAFNAMMEFYYARLDEEKSPE